MDQHPGHPNATNRASVNRQLTSRQIELWILIAQSITAKEISLRWKVSEKTVDYHRSELMSKLQIWDVAGLTREAIRIGLISL